MVVWLWRPSVLLKSNEAPESQLVSSSICSASLSYTLKPDTGWNVTGGLAGRENLPWSLLSDPFACQCTPWDWRGAGRAPQGQSSWCWDSTSHIPMCLMCLTHNSEVAQGDSRQAGQLTSILFGIFVSYYLGLLGPTIWSDNHFHLLMLKE